MLDDSKSSMLDDCKSASKQRRIRQLQNNQLERWRNTKVLKRFKQECNNFLWMLSKHNETTSQALNWLRNHFASVERSWTFIDHVAHLFVGCSLQSLRSTETSVLKDILLFFQEQGCNLFDPFGASPLRLALRKGNLNMACALVEGLGTPIDLPEKIELDRVNGRMIGMLPIPVRRRTVGRLRESVRAYNALDPAVTMKETEELFLKYPVFVWKTVLGFLFQKVVEPNWNEWKFKLV